MLTPISGTISGVQILGHGNSDIRYSIGYHIGYPDIGIPISDTISGDDGCPDEALMTPCASEHALY